MSTPVPARPTTWSLLGLRDQLRRDLGRRAHDERIEFPDPLGQLIGIHVEAELDLEVLAEQLDAGVGDLLLDQDLHGRASGTFSTTQSMQAVSAWRSAGSTAGNMPIRNWLRPSLR